MNLIEYCKRKNLNIAALSSNSLKTLAHGYLAGFNPTQERINIVLAIENGKLTPDQVTENLINQALTEYKNKTRST